MSAPAAIRLATKALEDYEEHRKAMGLPPLRELPVEPAPFVKHTDLDGVEFFDGCREDWPFLAAHASSASCAYLGDLMPPEALLPDARGKFRITVEFWPEERK